MSAGKGDTYRKVDKKKFDTNYDKIFRKDKNNKLTTTYYKDNVRYEISIAVDSTCPGCNFVNEAKPTTYCFNLVYHTCENCKATLISDQNEVTKKFIWRLPRKNL